MTQFDPSTLFGIVDVMGVVANGLLGAVLARTLKFDIVGFVVMAIISALGGGLLRDIILGVGFPVALTNPAYLTGALAAAFVGYFVNMDGKRFSRVLTLLDLLALGTWSATGTIKAAGYGLAPIPAILLGVTTSVGGGMIRDITVGRVPIIFGGNELYATISVVGSVVALLFHKAGYSDLGMAASIAICLILGLVARWRKWTLPRGGMDIEATKARRNLRTFKARHTVDRHPTEVLPVQKRPDPSE